MRTGNEKSEKNNRHLFNSSWSVKIIANKDIPILAVHTSSSIKRGRPFPLPLSFCWLFDLLWWIGNSRNDTMGLDFKMAADAMLLGPCTTMKKVWLCCKREATRRESWRTTKTWWEAQPALSFPAVSFKGQHLFFPPPSPLSFPPSLYLEVSVERWAHWVLPKLKSRAKTWWLFLWF